MRMGMRIMAELTIISETGMFYSACRCTYGGTVEWYGFAPIKKGSPAGPGAVHRDARDALINHSISFDSRIRHPTTQAKVQNHFHA
jgi:hypothetical protein